MLKKELEQIMGKKEVRQQFNIPDDAVLVKTAQTKKYTIFLFHHKSGGGFIDGDRIVVKVDSQGQGSISAKWDYDELPPAPGVPLLSRLLRKGEKVALIDPDNPFYIWDKKPAKHQACLLSWKKGQLVIKDRQTGKVIGHGTPPPNKALSASAPSGAGDTEGWRQWRESARDFFIDLGFDTTEIFIGDGVHTKAHVLNAIGDPETKVVYGIAHGTHIYSDLWTTTEIVARLAGRDKVIFAFLAHCGSHCYTGSGTLSDVFRKGSMVDTVTVGYCDMASAGCSEAWVHSIQWQNKFFDYMRQGMTCGEAFEESIADFPECEGCMRFCGDENLILKGGDQVSSVKVTVNLVKKVSEVELTVQEGSPDFPIMGAVCSFDAKLGITDEGGKYTWNGIIPGTYQLSVTAAGYLTPEGGEVHTQTITVP